MESAGHSQQLLSLTPIPGSTNFTGVFSPVQPLTVDNSYSDALPSANFTYHFTDNLQLRAAASKAITRPTFSQLGVDVNWEINSPPPRVTRNGNPNLRPIKATSYDASLEWYGRQGASASVAVFYKDIDGFITTANFPEQIIGQTFQVAAPINGDTAKIKGLEVGVQYLMDNGLGASANYTYADSKANITNNGVQVSTDLDGLSKNTYNLSAFFEKYGASARLSYSYRSDFVACATCGPVSQPTTTDATGFLDFSASYSFKDTYTVYFDATNLTEEKTHTYSVDKRYAMYYEPYSRRFEIGLRAKF
jgi:TonB-dependent receptor